MTNNEIIQPYYFSGKKEYSAEVDSNGSMKFFNNLIWMNSEEAAFYLRKTVGALRTAVCRGQISAKKFQRRLYFRRKDLDSLLENSQTIGGF
jgi:hypothetical protein